MKHLYLSLFFIVASVSVGFASFNFYLNGYLQNKNDIKYIVLEYRNSNNIYISDTAYIKNNTFIFSGEISEPQMVELFAEKKSKEYNQKNEISFFLDPGISKIFLNQNSFKTFKHTGLTTQNELETFRLKSNNIEDSISTFDSLMKSTYNKNDKSLDDTITIEYYYSIKKQLQYKDFKNQLSFINENPNSYVAIYFLKNLVDRLQLHEIITLYDIISDSIKNSYYGKDIKRKIDLIVNSREGGKMIDIISKDINNKDFELSSILNKSKIIIHIWASWCLPCIKEIVALHPYYKDLNQSLVNIIFISVDKSEDELRDGIFKYRLEKFVNLRLPSIDSYIYMNGIPLVLLIDNNGIITKRIEGASESAKSDILNFIVK